MIEHDDPKDEVGSFAPPPAADRKRVTFAIPPSAPVKSCRSCGAPIVWVKSVGGSNMPLEAEGPNRGESHFAHCAQAHMWRVRR